MRSTLHRNWRCIVLSVYVARVSIDVTSKHLAPTGIGELPLGGVMFHAKALIRLKSGRVRADGKFLLSQAILCFVLASSADVARAGIVTQDFNDVFPTRYETNLSYQTDGPTTSADVSHPWRGLDRLALIVPVPEPGYLSLLAGGLLALRLLRRRKSAGPISSPRRPSSETRPRFPKLP